MNELDAYIDLTAALSKLDRSVEEMREYTLLRQNGGCSISEEYKKWSEAEKDFDDVKNKIFIWKKTATFGQASP